MWIECSELYDCVSAGKSESILYRNVYFNISVMNVGRRVFLVLVIAIALITCVSITHFYTPSAEAEQAKTVKVLHAGSLAVPLAEAERQFEVANPGIDVRRESMGSVKAVRQITDVGKPADVLAVADYSLIPGMMYPGYADWYVRFATNDMVLVYNPELSMYADEITPENWYNILRRDDVVFGFSNPNHDPCGYRSLMVMQLAELHYGDDHIFDDLVLNTTAITVREEDGGYIITVPEDPKPDTGKVNIRPKSVELVALVEQGGLDYAFEYRSVAVQHNLAFVDLPEQIDLSRIEYAAVYNRVKVQTVDGKTKTGKPIVYGITVPNNAENPELGLEFVKFVIGDTGQRIFTDVGQPPIVPPEGSGNLPEELKSLVNVEPMEPRPTAIQTPTSTTKPVATPAQKAPGFDTGLAITGIFAIIYPILRRKKKR